MQAMILQPQSPSLGNLFEPYSLFLDQKGILNLLEYPLILMRRQLILLVLVFPHETNL